MQRWRFVNRSSWKNFTPGQAVERFREMEIGLKKEPGQRHVRQRETVMRVQPYLNFDGREEAIDFYKSAVHADVKMLMRFKESPDQSMMSPDSGEKIQHSELRIGESTIFVSDGHAPGQPNFNVSLPSR